MGQQDISYKEFFSDPQNVADLLCGFVDKDFNNMQEVITMTRDFAAIERANERTEIQASVIENMKNLGKTADEIAKLSGFDIKIVMEYFK